MGEIPAMSAQERAAIYDRVVREGRRRLRRRRTAGLAGLMALGAGIGLTVSSLDSSASGRAVIVGGDSAPMSAICQPGGVPRPGVARADAGVNFGSLPAGFEPVSADAVGPNGAAGEVASPDGRSDSMTRLAVELSFGSAVFSPGSDSTAASVEGHPAQVSVSPVTSGHGPGMVTVVWHPDPGAAIEVSAYGLPTARVLAAAQTVRYSPGVTAAALGDMGPVISRTAAIVIASGGAASSTTGQVITWLVDGKELAAAMLAQGEGGEIITQLAEQNRPFWVVAMIGDYRNTGETPYDNGPDGGVGHLEVFVIDASNGSISQQAQSPSATIVAEYARLVDHSTDQPCPSPSSTDPSLQPPERPSGGASPVSRP